MSFSEKAEYQPKDARLVKKDAQKEFLSALEKIRPEVLDDLSACLMTDFRESGINEIDEPYLSNQLREMIADNEIRIPDTLRPLNGFRLRLHRWISNQKWTITTDWFIKETFDTWFFWCEFYEQDKETGRRGFASTRLSSVSLDRMPRLSPLIIPFPDWEPYNRREAEYKKEAERLFKEELHRYLNEVRQAYEKLGKPITGRHLKPDHYDWLVRYLYDEKQTDIQRSAGIGDPSQTTTVSNAIRRVARLLDLELPEKRGKKSDIR